MNEHFNIGETVWYAKMECITKSIKCPDCFGLTYLTVILGDQSEITIECQTCKSGFEPAKGYVTYTAWEPKSILVTIDGMDIRENSTTYWFKEGYGSSNDSVYRNKDSADIRGIELAQEKEKKELELIQRKSKNHKSWAWHVTHYRGKIRNAKREIEQNEARLNYAKSQVKK